MNTKKVMIMAGMLFLSVAVFAQGPQGNQKNKGQAACSNIPDLTEDQQAKIKDLRTAHMKEVMPLRNQLNEKKAQLNTISTAQTVDMNKVYALIDEIGKLKTDMHKKQAKHKQDVRTVLNDNQRVYFDMNSGKKHQNQQKMQCRRN